MEKFNNNSQLMTQRGAMSDEAPLAPVPQASAQYQPIPIDLGMKLSQSLCREVAQARASPKPLSEEAHQAPAPATAPCLSLSSNDSKTDSIFTVTKPNQKLIYFEDKAEIGEIFDKALFDRIN